MSWRDQYRPAAFRGVPCFLRDVTSSGGRRLATHQYPRNDNTEHEDMGAAEQSLSVLVFVIGDDYIGKKDRLEAALLQKGPGNLTHPFRGDIPVSVDKYSIRESSDRGGAAFFTISFNVEGEASVSKSADTGRTVGIAGDGMLSAAEESFVNSYSLSGQPNSSVVDARGMIDSAFDAMEKAKLSAASAAEFKQKISNARGRAIELSLQPSILAFEFNNLIAFGIDDVNSAISFKDRMREQRELFDFTQSTVSSIPLSVSDEPDYPAKQIQLYMSYSVISSMATLIPLIEYDSTADAIGEQEQILSRIDTLLMYEPIDIAVYESLRDLMAAVYGFIQEEKARLPLLVDEIIPFDTNALALSYMVYGHLDEVDAIVANNNIIHPGFIPSGSVKLRAFRE